MKNNNQRKNKKERKERKRIQKKLKIPILSLQHKWKTKKLQKFLRNLSN